MKTLKKILLLVFVVLFFVFNKKSPKVILEQPKIWLIIETPSGGHLSLFNAYLDTRKGKFVVINVAGSKYSNKDGQIFCHIEMNDGEQTIVVEALESKAKVVTKRKFKITVDIHFHLSL